MTAFAISRRSFGVIAGCWIVLSGCGGETGTTCRKPGERYPEHEISVAEARVREGELVRIEGALIARRGRPSELCTSLSDDRPPECRGPSLTVEGLRDTIAFEHGESEGDTEWWERVTMAGRIDGDTIRYEISCLAREVQQHLGDEVGEEPQFNAFGSNADAERLDYAPVREKMPWGLRAKYGWFGVSVPSEERRKPLFAFEIRNRRATADGVYWLRESGNWIAVKHYGNEIALVWLSGTTRLLDKRFQRIDAIMRDFESRRVETRP